MQFYTSYGYVELIDSGFREQGNVIAEMISTSLFKKTQPLIRYATGDFIEIDNEGKIRSVLGRTSNFLIGKDGNLIPAVITNRPETKANVLLIQYYQDTPGFFDNDITVNEHFTNADRKMIEEDIYDTFGDTLKGTVKIVDCIEQTTREVSTRNWYKSWMYSRTLTHYNDCWLINSDKKYDLLDLTYNKGDINI